MAENSDTREQLIDDLKTGMTYDDIVDEAEGYGVSKRYARELLNDLRDEGYEIQEECVDENGRKKFFLEESVDEMLEPDEEPVNHSEPKRQSSRAKQSITREINEYMSELEEEVKQYSQDQNPVKWDDEQLNREGNQDMLLHETDVHFGDVVKNEKGEIIYDSDIAEELTRYAKEQALKVKEMREEMGTEFDTMHLLLGGDIVTNEAIYSSQPHDIDETIKEQLERATAVYDGMIESFSEEFDQLQVVGMPGNHGEFRVKGSSDDANADDLLYDRLELLSEARDLDNVQFVKTDRADNVTFDFRDWTGLLTHGQNRLSHIGTSSPQSDWLSIKDKYDFDVGWRGHYHEGKEEPVNDAKVFMTDSRKPGGDFEDTMATYGDPELRVYGSDDENPIAWVEFFDLPDVEELKDE